MAAQNGTLTVQIPTGFRTIDIYLPDAAGTLGTFNLNGPATSTSPPNFRAMSSGTIVDVSVPASPTATSGVFVINSGLVNGGVVRWANQVNTLATRQPLAIGFNAGDFIGINLTT